MTLFRSKPQPQSPEPPKRTKMQADLLAVGAHQVPTKEPWKIPGDPMSVATKNGEVFLSYTGMKDAMLLAKEQVAQKTGRHIQEVRWRIVQVSDFDNMNGNVCSPGQYEFSFENGVNTFQIRSVGDQFELVILIGLLTTDIKEHVANVRLLTDGNRLRDYPAALIQAAQGDWFLLPEGPMIIDRHARLDIEVTLVGLPANARLKGRAFPLAVGFPIVG